MKIAGQKAIKFATGASNWDYYFISRGAIALKPLTFGLLQNRKAARKRPTMETSATSST